MLGLGTWGLGDLGINFLPISLFPYLPISLSLLFVSFFFRFHITTRFIISISDGNSGNTTRFNYNQAENNFSIVDFSGLICDYIFDNLGRKIKITIQDGTNIYITNYNQLTKMRSHLLKRK